MLEEVVNIKGLEIYTPEGIFVGKVDEVVFDIPNKRTEGLFVRDANPVLVDENVTIKIPYRWIQSIGDVIILKAFPKHISRTREIIFS